MANREQTAPAGLMAVRPSLVLFILTVLAVAGAHGHERQEQSHPLDGAAAERALDGAEWLLERARSADRPVAPLPDDAEARELSPWLQDAAGLAERETLSAFRAYLESRGYDTGDVGAIGHWSEDFGRVLTAYEALREGAVGEDPSPLYEELKTIPVGQDADGSRARVTALRRRIRLTSVSEAEAEAARPHRDRIETLLQAAREWKQ